MAAAAVTRHPALANLDLNDLQNDIHRLENLVRDTQDLASNLRLVPVGQAFYRMQRVVRDLLRETGKAVDLVMIGEEVELDKLLIDQLSEPLLHLIRNSVDHGLETPEERLKAGKPERGHITLKAAQVGREIQITVSDDGRGLDRQAILRRARQNGLLAETEDPPDDVLWGFIFRPRILHSRESLEPLRPRCGNGRRPNHGKSFARPGDRPNRKRPGLQLYPRHPPHAGFS